MHEGSEIFGLFVSLGFSYMHPIFIVVKIVYN